MKKVSSHWDTILKCIIINTAFTSHVKGLRLFTLHSCQLQIYSRWLINTFYDIYFCLYKNIMQTHNDLF